MELTPEQNAAVAQWWAVNDDGSYECMDNERYAIKGNQEQEAVYDEQVRLGCCGSCDVEIPLPDGTILLYGFNYGH